MSLPTCARWRCGGGRATQVDHMGCRRLSSRRRVLGRNWSVKQSGRKRRTCHIQTVGQLSHMQGVACPLSHQQMEPSLTTTAFFAMQELGISAAAQTLVGLAPVKEKKERKPKAARWGWLLEQGGRNAGRSTTDSRAVMRRVQEAGWQTARSYAFTLYAWVRRCQQAEGQRQVQRLTWLLVRHPHSTSCNPLPYA